jgi:protein SCO1
MVRFAIVLTIEQAKGKLSLQRLFRVSFLLALALLAGCSSSKPASIAAKRYHLSGKVVSIDKANLSVVINGDDVPGFMPAMTMPYAVKNDGDLARLSAGDSIAADIVVGENASWLENIKVTPHAKPTIRPPL